MNVLGHSHVALGLGTDEPAYLLGAVLPDLASMARVRLDRSRLGGRLGEGVRCHVAADAAFHAEPRFRQGSAALRDELREGGVPTGPARAVAHVGWELLLDGNLRTGPAPEAYRRALELGDHAGVAMAEAHRARWARLLAHRHRLPELPYDDPRWVAERLVSILAPRPRLRLMPRHVPVVVAALQGHAERVAAVAPAVLADTVRRTAAGLVPAAS